ADADGLDAAEQLGQEWLAPVILVSGNPTAALLAQAAQAPCVLGCLPKPITARELAPAMAVAVGRFRPLRQPRRLAEERQWGIARLRRALEDRKIGEEAGRDLAVCWPLC